MEEEAEEKIEAEEIMIAWTKALTGAKINEQKSLEP